MFTKNELLHKYFSLHKKWSSPLRISSGNVTKSTVYCGFGHIYWKNQLWKTSFFMQYLQDIVEFLSSFSGFTEDQSSNYLEEELLMAASNTVTSPAYKMRSWRNQEKSNKTRFPFQYITFQYITSIYRTVCSDHVTYTFQSESTLYICLNIKELLARNRGDIWSLSNCSGTWTHNHLARKRTLNHLAKTGRNFLNFFSYSAQIYSNETLMPRRLSVVKYLCWVLSKHFNRSCSLPH